MGDELREWWVGTLLGQERAAHPVFGEKLKVKVDGDVVTLSGEVETAEEAQGLEREAYQIDTVERVINHLNVSGTTETYHLQTVIAVFADEGAAQLAGKAAAYWTVREGNEAQVVEDVDDARRLLSQRADDACAPESAIESLVQAVQGGKVLLVARVPEDDALRVVSALEGSRAEDIRTLPPEPDNVEAA